MSIRLRLSGRSSKETVCCEKSFVADNILDLSATWQFLLSAPSPPWLPSPLRRASNSSPLTSMRCWPTCTTQRLTREGQPWCGLTYLVQDSTWWRAQSPQLVSSLVPPPKALAYLRYGLYPSHFCLLLWSAVSLNGKALWPLTVSWIRERYLSQGAARNERNC